jgi:HEAT repeat protein
MSEQQNKLEILKKGTSDEKIEVLYSLSAEDLNSEFVKAIAQLVQDEDKGVRNAASMQIINSALPEFAYHVVPYVSSPDISVRNLAGEILLKLGSNAVDAMVQFEHQDDDDTLKFLIDILGLIGDQRASLFVMGILSISENDNVILACIEALGNLRYESSVDVLMLFYDRNELYKPTTVEALGKIGSRAALNFLITKFPTEDELTQYSILESLGNLGDIETYFFLLEQVNTVTGPLVLPLITSISLLKDRFNLDIPYDNRMKSLLMYTISEGTLAHKKVAFNLIETFEDKDILFTSLNLLGEDYELDEMIKSKLFGTSEYIYHEISRVINSKPKNLRHVLNMFQQIIAYVNEYRIPVEVPMLELRGITQSISGLLDHTDEEVRRASMEILFTLDPETALMFIDSMIGDENMWNRIRLVELLEQYPIEAVEVPLKKLTKDEDEMVSDRASFVYNYKTNNVSTNTN